MLVLRFVISLVILITRLVECGSKLYNGQRMFTDSRIIRFVDPAKHGFHVILEEDFVKSHLQPVHLPTVYASAIGLKSPGELNHRIGKPQRRMSNETSGRSEGSSRVTKILYPENGNPEDGLLDGHTIKLLGLEERSWYYVCVEFESNVNRHEIATGTSCRLARTLDKFGKSVESTISEIELIEVSDESIRVQVNVDADFPLRLFMYLHPNPNDESGPITGHNSASPAQTFMVKRPQRINVAFGSLKPDSSYGRVCIFEEPLLEAYTAMGRSARVVHERCYFHDLRTKPQNGDYMRKMYENGILFMSEQPRALAALGEKEMAKLVSSSAIAEQSCYLFTVSVFLFIMHFQLTFCR